MALLESLQLVYLGAWLGLQSHREHSGLKMSGLLVHASAASVMVGRRQLAAARRRRTKREFVSNWML